ncbi:hypothetical protein K0B04_04150 [Patescibacteria group bacterium]|nr:hypothetical protein [Patescibacteria group bacterium]
MSSYTYLSTFSPENSVVVKDLFINKINDIVIELEARGIIVFSTSKKFNKSLDDKLLNNTFLVIKQFDNLVGTYFKPIFQWAGRHSLANLENTAKELGFKSFRIVTKDKGKIVSRYKRAVKAMENKIGKEIGMRVNRLNPDTEIWIMYTKDKFGFILLKIN